MGVKMRIHFSGIGGIGMSALAQIAVTQHYVQGSDIKQSYITDKLQQMGIKIFFKQTEENITNDLDLFVYSSAIERTNPEYREALNKKIKILHRSEYLNEVIKDKKVIAITGSSGKTTTTTLTGILLNKIGIKSSLITGGWIKSINSNVIWENSELVVLEADESDGSLLNYPTHIGLINDLSNDVNLNTSKFKDIPINNITDKLKEVFAEFVHKIKKSNGKVIVSTDNELKQFIKENNLEVDSLFGIFNSPEEALEKNLSQKKKIPLIYCSNICQREENGYPLTEFDLHIKIGNEDLKIGRAKIKTIGYYNALNFTATASIVYILTEKIEALKELCKISEESEFTKRRFEILLNCIFNNKRLIVVDDYAHNPKKLKALTTNLNYVYKNYKRIVVFQPHRYTRTMLFWDSFQSSFSNLDSLVILPIYEAGEKPIENINSQKLTHQIQQNNKTIKEITHIETEERLFSYLEEKIQEDNTIIVFAGAGNITSIAHKFSSIFSEIKT